MVLMLEIAELAFLNKKSNYILDLFTGKKTLVDLISKWKMFTIEVA